MKVIIIDSDAVARENISSKIKAFWPSEIEITMLDSIQDCYNALQREQEDYLEATDGTGKTKASVKTKDIISVHKEKNTKYILVNTKQDTIRIRCGLNKFIRQLKNDNFAFLERSTVINVGYIKMIEGNKLILQTGEQFEISPGRKREIESLWIKRINQDKL